MSNDLTLNKVAAAALLFFAGAAGAVDPPAQVVKDATDRIQALIKQHRDEYTHDKAKFYAAVDGVVAPAFDVPYVAQITLGRAWRTANDSQRSRFQAAFKNTLIHAYSDALLDNSDSSSVDWQHASTSGDTASVHANIVRTSGPPVALGFELHRVTSGDWRAYDITVEGVSLITNFRSQFASEVKRNGLDALIQRLESGGSV